MEELSHLTTESRNPQSESIDTLSALEIAELMNRQDALIAAAVAKELPSIAKGIDAIANALSNGGRLVYVGAGTSGRLGVLDSTECPPTFNSPVGQVIGIIAGGPAALTQAVEGAEDHPEMAAKDLINQHVSDKDVVVGIATSGRTPYVLAAVEFARNVGARSIGLSCNANSPLCAVADIAITPVVGPEIITGSTRLKAGTATKMVLNMLSTGAMVRIGKTYGNLMVDLRATNTKLQDRSERIVAELAEVTREVATSCLAESQGEVKVAIVAARIPCSIDQARQRLESMGGHVRDAIRGIKEHE